MFKRTIITLFYILHFKAGWAQTAPTRPPGDNSNSIATTAFVQQNASTLTIPDSFCTVDRTGATDMGACINSAIAAAKSCNNASATPGFGRVYLRAGTYLITTPIVPKSCTLVFGDGPGRTVLLTNSNAPFGPPAGQQLIHFTLDNLTFKDSGTHSGAVAMTYPNIQDSRLTNLGFSGYTTGSLISIATAAVTTFDDTGAMWNNSNSIFNFAINWQADGCANCIQLAGHYGSTPTASPPNSSNVPDQAVTQNRYDNIILFNCSGKCVDVVKATDTEFFTNLFIRMTSNSAVCAQLGDDAAFPGNNYVASIHFQITCTIQSPATTLLGFRAQNWTYGHIIDFDTDAVPSAVTIAQAQASVTQFKLELCGNNFHTQLVDNNGFNTNRVCKSDDFGSGSIGQATYYRVGNGSSTAPVWGFDNDFANGLYLAAAGQAAFSKSLRIDGHILSGAASTPTLSACGTGPAFAGTASDTAGRVTVGSGPPTACTLTFGTAFATAPVCTITPVGTTQQPFLSAISTTAITWSWGTATAGQQFNYTCLALPGG